MDRKQNKSGNGDKQDDIKECQHERNIEEIDGYQISNDEFWY